jgi:hypothetical protein
LSNNIFFFHSLENFSQFYCSQVNYDINTRLLYCTYKENISLNERNCKQNDSIDILLQTFPIQVFNVEQ